MKMYIFLEYCLFSLQSTFNHVKYAHNGETCSGTLELITECKITLHE